MNYVPIEQQTELTLLLKIKTAFKNSLSHPLTNSLSRSSLLSSTCWPFIVRVIAFELDLYRIVRHHIPVYFRYFGQYLSGSNHVRNKKRAQQTH